VLNLESLDTVHDKIQYNLYSLHVKIHYMSKYTTCQNTLHVKIHYMSRYTTCQDTLHVKIHYISRYTTILTTRTSLAQSLSLFLFSETFFVDKTFTIREREGKKNREAVDDRQEGERDGGRERNREREKPKCSHLLVQ